MQRSAMASEMLRRYAGVLDSLGHPDQSIHIEAVGRLLGEGLDERAERLEIDISREMAVERFNEVEQTFSDTDRP